jgi:hypothetical protein
MGRGEKSDLYKRCREEKEKFFVGWNFIDVNEDTCAIMDAPFMRAAQARGDNVYLTAARLWALREYSGFYMDEDVAPNADNPVAMKEYERLSSYEFVIGKESGNTFCDAIIGAAPKSEAMARLYFTFPWGCDADEPLVNYGPTRTTAIVNSFPQHVKERCALLEQEVLYPWYFGQEPRINNNAKTIAKHYWTASWVK